MLCNKVRKAEHKHLLSVLIRMRKYFIGLFMLCGFDIIKIDLFEIHTSYCIGIRGCQRCNFELQSALNSLNLRVQLVEHVD